MPTYINCVYCTAPLEVEHEMAYRLKYHPKCKRDVDRERYHHNGSGREATRRPCEQCSKMFSAKRSDAKYCSPRCRTAAHRELHRE